MGIKEKTATAVKVLQENNEIATDLFCDLIILYSCYRGEGLSESQKEKNEVVLLAMKNVILSNSSHELE